MRRAVLLSFAALALTAPVALYGQGPGPTVKVPNFAGNWVYQVPPPVEGRGAGPRVGGLDGGGYTNWGPVAATLIITQTATEITLDRGSGETKWVYRLDGTELVIPDPSNKEPGGPYPFKTKTRVDGAKLILYTRQGLNQQRDILTVNGNVLNMTRDTETPPGSGIDIKLVYSKAI
ncbi:MAG: hypothetical protein ABJA98_27140 [Acidobacteriota bacterium]